MINFLRGALLFCYVFMIVVGIVRWVKGFPCGYLPFVLGWVNALMWFLMSIEVTS